MNRVPLTLFIVIALFFAVPARAMQFELPVQCDMGSDCFIQNYVDQQSGDGWRDYRCRHLSYNQHKGVDFRTRNYVLMKNGVNVLASQTGTVKGTRDEVEDKFPWEHEVAEIQDKQCGNGVIIDHGEGWETQYCHLKKGSILVKKDDVVQAGQVLGQIGMSGQTEFPHVHVSFRKDGKDLDPFTTEPMETSCNLATPPASLWSPAALKQLDYIGTAILGFGISHQEPKKDGARQGEFALNEMKFSDGPLIAWVDIMGLEKEDTLHFTFYDHEGTKIADYTKQIESDQALYFQYFGKTMPSSGWTPGIYKVEFALLRSEETGKEPVAILTRGKEINIYQTAGSKGGAN